MWMGAGVIMGCTYEKYKKEMNQMMKTLENKAVKTKKVKAFYRKTFTFLINFF